MSSYAPDSWVIIKIAGDDPHYRVLAGWAGGYTQGTSWRMNSGITRVEEDDTYFKFFGSSGSVYYCHKDMYGLRISNTYVWNAFKEKHGDLVELMDEETDWNNMDWIIGNETV